MHRTPRTTRALAGGLAITVALIVSACGTSGGSDAAKEDSTTTEKTTATDAVTTTDVVTTTEAAADGAQARADSVDLTVSDFPDGWTSSPASPDDEDSPIKACDPSFSNDDAKLAKHSTDDFTVGSLDDADGTTFSAETVVFTDADTADGAVEVFNDADVVSCIDEALKKQLGDSTGLTVEGSLADDDLDVGTDNSSGVSATYTMTASDGSTVNATVAVLTFSTGDIGTMVTILSLGDSLDPSSVQDPIQALAELQGEA